MQRRGDGEGENTSDQSPARLHRKQKRGNRGQKQQKIFLRLPRQKKSPRFGYPRLYLRSGIAQRYFQGGFLSANLKMKTFSGEAPVRKAADNPLSPPTLVREAAESVTWAFFFVRKAAESLALAYFDTFVVSPNFGQSRHRNFPGFCKKKLAGVGKPPFWWYKGEHFNSQVSPQEAQWHHSGY